MTNVRLWSVLLSVLIFVQLGCNFQDSEDNVGDRKNAAEVVKNHPNFQLKVFYQPGAEPYTGQLFTNGTQVWSIMENTLGQILPPGVNQVAMPFTRAEMEIINLPQKRMWGKRRLSRLSQDIRFAQSGGSANTLSVVFLSGYYRPNENAVGLHFAGRPVVFIFKPSVIQLQGDQIQQAIAEQAVIAHEVGHAIGLVNGRVNMVGVNHEDPASPGHCSNPRCVMYRDNNGRETAMRYVDQVRATGNFSLFGQECLQDLSSHYSQQF